MGELWVVTYDISDGKRLSRVFKMLKGYGDHIQYSVFLCDLTKKDQIILKGKLDRLIHHQEDQILFMNLGNSERDWDPVFDSLGRSFKIEENSTVFI